MGNRHQNTKKIQNYKEKRLFLLRIEPQGVSSRIQFSIHFPSQLAYPTPKQKFYER